MTAVEALSLALASALVLVAALATTALLRPRTTADLLTAVGVLASGEVAVLTGVSGALGHLRPGVVLAGTVAWAALALLVAGPHLRALPRPRVDLRRLRHHPWTVALVAVAAGALAWQALVAVVLPVYAFDALTYHGTTLATWLQRGDIAPPRLSACCAHYANTAELESVWSMLLLGNDSLVDAVQLGFVLLAAAAVAGLARSCGLDRAHATAAAAITVATPVLLAQSSTNYVDVMVAAWSLAALHALVRFAATRDLRHLVPASVAAGLLLGTKGTGIVWGAALVGSGVVVVAVCRRRGWLATASAVRAASILVLVPVALGSYWYVRNWVQEGNPLHPFHVTIAGVEIFDGPTEIDEFLTIPDGGADQPEPEAIVRSWAADLDFWHQRSYDYQQRAGGLGPTFAWLGLPLLVPIGSIAMRRRLPVGVAFAITAGVFVVQPYRWWSRFTIQLAALGAVSIVAAISWLPQRSLKAALRVAALALVVAGVGITSRTVDPASRAPTLSAGEVLDLVGEPSSDRMLGDLFFPEYGFLEALPDDARVVVDIDAEPLRFLYPLYGPSWTRTVLAAADEPALGPDTWVVTAAGRPLDRAVRADGRFELVADERDVRTWYRP